MTTDTIATRRLHLVVMSPAMLDADAEADGGLAALLGASVPPLWPPENWEPHVFEFLRRQATETPYAVPWNRYVVLQGEPRTLIGVVNAFPRSASEAEVGYSVLAPWQGHGFATECLLALIRELLREPGLERVTAQTFPALPASVRVLEKCHFVPDGKGEEEGTVRYRLDRAAFTCAAADS